MHPTFSAVDLIGNGYLTESLRVASEQIADAATIDRILREHAGFPVGPFELLAQGERDALQARMVSIYQQSFDDPRHRPNELGAIQKLAEPAVPQVGELPPVWVSSRAVRRAELLQLLKNLGAKIETGTSPSTQALCIVAPLGFDVTTMAIVERLDPARTLGIDLLIDDALTQRRVLATNPATRADMRDAAHALFARDGKAVSVTRDSGGFVTQRVAAHLVNIACDLCQQGQCTPAELESAVTTGLGHALGPLALGDKLGPTEVLEVLFNVQTVYGDPRYRPSPWLRRRGAIGLSLSHVEP